MRSRALRVVPRVRRRLLDEGLDRMRFRLDTFPRPDYQPLPWLGLDRARRDTGSEARFAAILPLLRELDVRTAVDVGCNVGWFSFRLAEAGIATVGVESDPRYYRTALYAARRVGRRDVGFLVLEVDERTVDLLPNADCVLFLSVWHHVVKRAGLDAATALLGRLWERTRTVLVFETGEREMGPEYRLPAFDPEPAAWLERYLAAACPGGSVRQLGRHPAFAPDGRACSRSLVAVVRSDRG